eukprot:TRINITY_DN5929_c0_g1_i1.p1 TRINITY_DN5929_c0_g1~~TRINITY_DN5929_c0_g1_i1.p1  ORF type:complete len:828 (+),score=194.91 TRINITY_DN5929_c0_g1_i1:94-2577(+)
MKNPISWFCRCGPDDSTVVTKENRLLLLQTQESSKREGIRRKWTEESMYLITKRKNGITTVTNPKRKSILEPVFDIDIGSKMTGLRMKIVHIFRTFDDDCDDKWNFREVTVWGFTCCSRKISEQEFSSMKDEVGCTGSHLTLAHMVAWYLRQGDRLVNNHFATCVVNEEKTTLDVAGGMQPISIVDIKDMGAALQRFIDVDTGSKRWYAIAVRGIQVAIQRTGAEQKYKLRRRELLLQVVAWVNPTQILKVMSLSDLPRKTESSLQRRREQRGSFCSENDFQLSESGAGDGSVAQLHDLSPYTPGCDDIQPPPYDAILEALPVQHSALQFGDSIAAAYTSELSKTAAVAASIVVSAVASPSDVCSSESDMESTREHASEVSDVPPETAKQIPQEVEEEQPQAMSYRVNLTPHLWLSIVENTLAATESCCNWVFEPEPVDEEGCYSLRTEGANRMYVSGIDPKIVCCHGDPTHRVIWKLTYLESKVVILQDIKSGGYLRLNAAEDDSPFAKFTLHDSPEDATHCNLMDPLPEDSEYIQGRDTTTTTTTTSSISQSPEPEQSTSIHPQLTKENLALALDDIEGIQCVQSEASPTLSEMLMSTSSPIITARRMEDVGVSTDDILKIAEEESLSSSAVLKKGSYGGGTTRKIVKKSKTATPTLKLAKSSPLLKVTKTSSTPRLTPRVASSRTIKPETKSPLLVSKKNMKASSATHIKPSSSISSLRSASSTGLSSSTKSISSAAIKKLATPKAVPPKSPSVSSAASPAVRPVRKILKKSLSASSPSISSASPPVTPGAKSRSSSNITDGLPKKKIIKKKITKKAEKPAAEK